MTLNDRSRELITAPLSKLCTDLGIPGATAAVVADGETIAATAGVLNTRTMLPVTADSIFQIQSITKVWTATLVMQLVDEGRVDLDKPVTKYLPSFRTADALASANITVRHLLTHTGGFEGDDWRSTTDDDTALERFVADLVSQAPQQLAVGEQFSYCSTGFAVLGRLVETARELPYPQILRRYLAEPLDLTDFAVNAGQALGFRAAIGHVDSRPVRSWTHMPESNHPAGAQLSMSASGLAEFGRMHAAHGLAGNGTRVLSADAAQAMRQPLVPIPTETTMQGLGWRVDPATGLSFHGGDSLGVSAFLCTDPEAGAAIALAVNGGDAANLVPEYVNPILFELTGKVLSGAEPEPPATADIAAPRYAGRYEVRTAGCQVTVDETGRLWLTQESAAEAVTLIERAGVSVTLDAPSQLRRHAGDVFAILSADGSAAGKVEFLGHDAQGRARFLHISGRALPRVD